MGLQAVSQRFLDDMEFIRECRDFIPRKHLVPVWALIGIFAVSVFAVTFVYVEFPENRYFTFLAAIGVLIILFFLNYYLDSRYKNLINAVEFQNALFAGAAQLATQFCMIARHDGKIAYVDPSYDHNIFKFRNKMRNINALLDAGSVTEDAQTNLLKALAEGKSEKIPFRLPKTQRSARPLALTLDPIKIANTSEYSSNLSLSSSPLTRPSGYSLLRVQQEQFKKGYEDFIEDFRVGFYTLKNSGEFSYISETLEEKLGYGKGDIIAAKINISDLMFNQEMVKDLKNTKQDHQEVMIFRSRTNTPVYAFVNQLLVKNSTGKVLHRHGVVMPLSQEIITDTETSQKPARNADLIKYSPIATALLDRKGNITDYNRFFRDIAGISATRKNNNILDIAPSGQENIKQFFDDVVSGRNDGIKPLDIYIQTPQNENKAASLYLNRITDTYGQLQGIIAHMIDTTELKNLELRFVHSQKMQAVGQLAGGIAHDFNNLLTAMMGFCDLLLMRHPAGDASFADIMQVKQNANRAANLVRQLLAFSRKQTLQPEIIDITDALADLSNLIGRLIGENIELKMIHGRELKKIKVDQVQLEQVIINLAVNARDAMTDGGTLTIKTSNITVNDKNPINKLLVPPAEDEGIENGQYVLIEVIDTGSGMSREVMGKIFEPFFSTKAIGSGTGLGLSTVYGIVKQTGGYIYVSSKPGKGTKFSIFLKGFDGTAKNQERLKQEEGKNESQDLTGTGNILLVEDETPVRIFSNNALTNKGYNVLDADCAETALEIMKEKGDSIDIIITDVVMPGMSGPDMVEQISKDFPNIKVIFISGYGEDAFIETYGTERKFNFLSKPYSLKQLVLKVKEVLAVRV